MMTLANEEDCLDRIFWKVIGDAFPQEQRPRPGRISPLTQYTAEILAFEIDRYCGGCRRRWLALKEVLGSEGQYLGQVDFEYSRCAQRVSEAKGPRVKACAQDDDLLEPRSSFLEQHFIEILRASVEVAESTGKAAFEQPPRQLRCPVQDPLVWQESASGQVVAVCDLAGREAAKRTRPRGQVRRPRHVRLGAFEAHRRSESRMIMPCSNGPSGASAI